MRVIMRGVAVRCSARAEGWLRRRDVRLLERFWTSRGVRRPEQRALLIDAAQKTSPRRCEFDVHDGVAYVWNATRRQSEIYSISKAILELDAAFGEATDVVRMACQEPEILKLSNGAVLCRLLDMRSSTSGDRTNILKLVERQPRLLLNSDRALDRKAPPADQISAWEHGLLVSDDAQEWRQSYEKLRSLWRQKGHCHIGFVPEDDPELTAWATKQRGDAERQILPSERRALLAETGFEFSAAEAEWQRWFHEWRSEGRALTSSTAPLLTNWVSVQRVAHRTGHLSVGRRALLVAAGFDFDGADALS